MSKQKDEMRGDYGIENFESEGQFKLVCAEEDPTSDTEPQKVLESTAIKLSPEMESAKAFVQSVINAG